MEEEPDILKLDKDSLDILFSKLDPQSVLNLCNSSKQLRELCSRYKLWVFASGQFEKMSGDTLAMILKNMIPQEVVLFCATSPGFTRVCNRGNFWKTILRLHYGITDVENPREVYLEKTYMHFSLSYDDYDAAKVVDSLGHTIQIIEKFERDAYFVPVKRKLDLEQGIDLQIRATDFNRDVVWVGAIGDHTDVTGKAYRSRDDAILDFVETWGLEEFRKLLEFVTAKLRENMDDEMREYSQKQTAEIMKEVINSRYEEKLPNSRRHIVYFLSQRVMNKVFEMGYPQFQDGDTVTQARKKLFDYIKTNGFFCWNIDFSLDDPDLFYLKCFQVFQVKLHKTFPKWYTD